MTPRLAFAVAVVGGAAAGGGFALLVQALLPTPPALGPALDRLYPTTRPYARTTALHHLRNLIRMPRADLAILGRGEERYLLTLLGSGLGALLLPVALTAAALVLGVGVSPVLPVGAALLAAGAGPVLAHQNVLSRAKSARAEFQRSLCTYLDLAAAQVKGGSGPSQSLQRAAGICHGWVFDQIRGALARASLQLTPPWHELKRLSLDLNVVDLGDLADVMRSAGSEGAQVYQTLRARADSLRDQIRTQQLERAEIRTNKLDIPAAVLILVLLVLMIYPFLARLFS